MHEPLLFTAQRTTSSPLPTPPSKTDSPNNTNRNSSSSHGEANSLSEFFKMKRNVPVVQ